jgi:TerC family integral membrane protein
MARRTIHVAFVVGALTLFRETNAFAPIITRRATTIGLGHTVLRKSNQHKLTTQLGTTQRDDSALGETKRPPSFLEPGGGPTVAFAQDAALDTIYEQAIQRTLLWVALAGVVGGTIWALIDSNLGEEFFAAYLVEQSLSVDNLFVFLLLFDFFKVPIQCQDKILNWGIYGAIVMRAIMIGLGAVAIENFRPILLAFAAILVYSSGKVLLGSDDDEEEDMSENAIVKFSKRLIDSTDTMEGDNFFTIVDGVKKATPLLLCMIAIEISDVVFAVDSIPAVFGVTEVRVLANVSLRTKQL